MLGIRSEWGKFSDAVGGTYKSRDNGSGHGMRVSVQDGPWRIVFTRFTVNQDPLYIHHTVITACFVAAGDLRFTIDRETALSRAAHLLGFSDIKIGDEAFDAAFSVKGNNAAKVVELLADTNLRRRLLAQPRVHLTVFDKEGLITRNFRTDADVIFGDTRDDTIKLDGVSELYFHVPEDVEEQDRLADLYSIFTTLLRRLVDIGAAEEADPAAHSSAPEKLASDSAR